MGKVFSYFLALVCGLTLVLPPGWCCLFLPPPAAAREGEPAGPAHDCCPDGGRPERAPADPNAPPCPCSDRHTTLPKSETPVDGLPAVIVLPAVLAPAAPAAALAEPAVTPFFRPWHLLECVWRC